MTYQNLYNASINAPEKFWATQARSLPWFQHPQNILSENEKGFYHWFADGQINMAYCCLDVHVNNGRGSQTALIYESPVTQVTQHFSYAELQEKSARFAGGLRELGIGKGDTVVLYMPMVPEAVIAMLACARLGAIHSVVFGGFAPHELAMRINDAEPKAIIAASYGIEFDKKIAYQPLVDKAIQEANHQPEQVIYFRRGSEVDFVARAHERDFQELYSAAPLACEPMASTDPLYILYTSGTTGKPKGIVRDHGGYATALQFSMTHFYDVHAADVFWAASDVGWVVGHSYIVYAPLLLGCATVLYEGKPVRTPDAGAFWKLIEKHRVTHMFTAPTAIRAIRKEDPDGLLRHGYNCSSLRSLFLAGERCDPSTYHWVKELLEVPVIDHWWQTESGWPMLGIMMGVEAIEPKAGSAGLPVCGFNIHMLNEEGEEQPAGKEGFVTVKLPLPPGCLPTLWKNDERFKAGYLSHFPGYYQTGDGGYRDEEGFCYIMGRVDDVINVSGHRLSTGEMEELVAAHPAIAECAVVGIADELRGQRPIALVLLKDGQTTDEMAIEQELVQLIREKIGAVAYFRNAAVVKRLPKTRSGKILRKTIRHIANGEPYTIPSTIDDPEILTEIAAHLQQRQLGLAFQPAP
jgi:acyl-coenzyme A synthetase/AMP-(fatty) acid ligase